MAAWMLARRIGTTNPSRLQDLDALETQIEQGGQAARSSAARAIGAEVEDIDRWLHEWRHASTGPRRFGRNGPRR